jgi:hypothetical protein
VEPVLGRVPAEREPVQEPAGAVLQAAELELGPAVAEPERGPAVAVPERDQAAAVPEQSPVAAELVRAQAAELAIGQPHGHLVVLAKTKLVTAAPPRGLVRLLAAEEDLAEAAETMREPAATEAAAAWAAAVTAMAVAVVVAAVE